MERSGISSSTLITPIVCLGGGGIARVTACERGGEWPIIGVDVPVEVVVCLLSRYSTVLVMSKCLFLNPDGMHACNYSSLSSRALRHYERPVY